MRPVKNLIASILFIFICICGATSYAVTIDAQWKIYSSFDRTPVKIIDTADKSYFLVHQQPYLKNQAYYDFPSLALFYSDKKGNTLQIKQLDGLHLTSKSLIHTAEYSVSSGNLIVGYADGAIDIVSNDGSVSGVDIGKYVEYPGEDKLRRIVTSNFSDEIYLCTDFGYFIVDSKTGEFVGKVELNKVVDAVFPCGTGMILCSSGTVYESKDTNPTNFADFEHINNINSVLWCAPLNKDTFIALSGTVGGSLQLSAFKKDSEGSWKETQLCKDTFCATSENESFLNRYEGNFLPNQHGYLLFASNKVWQVETDESGEAKVRSIPLDKTMTPMGSWDFKNFLTYKDRGKFISRTAQNPEATTADSVQWIDNDEGVRPQAPADYIITHMAYSPAYGLMLVNHSCTTYMLNNASINPPMLSSISKDGWHSYMYPDPDTPPVYLNGSSELKLLWKTNINRYPITDPTGIAFDPIDPNKVIMPSLFGGVVIQDISKPNDTPIKICSPTDYLAKLPFALPELINQGWTSYSGLSAPRIDCDSTLWFAQINFQSGKSNNYGTVIFKYITKDRRKEMYTKSGDELCGETWLETLEMPYYGRYNSFCNSLAFKHPSSKNYLIADPAIWGSGISLINHNGTLNDTSDDTYHQLYGIIDRNGSNIEFIKINELIEDPITGEAIVAYYNGLASFHPGSDISVEGYIKGERLSYTKGETEMIMPENCQINNITLDNFGRLWIASNNQGVICLSADKKSVEYRLNTGNSPIPSNTIYGLGWDSGRNCLMISTENGLAEFTPDSYSNTSSIVGSFTISPSKITPGYNGHVSFRNLPLNSDICIRNSEGKTVKRINTGSNRFQTWNLLDTNGKRINPGIYTITLPDSPSQELIVTSGY